MLTKKILARRAERQKKAGEVAVTETQVTKAAITPAVAATIAEDVITETKPPEDVVAVEPEVIEEKEVKQPVSPIFSNDVKVDDVESTEYDD